MGCSCQGVSCHDKIEGAASMIGTDPTNQVQWAAVCAAPLENNSFLGRDGIRETWVGAYVRDDGALALRRV